MPTYPGTGQSPWGVQLKQYIDDGDARARAAEVAAEAAAADAEAARDVAVPAAATATSAAGAAAASATSAAASADTAAQAAEDAVAIVIGDEDAALAGAVGSPTSDTHLALADQVDNGSPFASALSASQGFDTADADGTTNDSPAIQATLDAGVVSKARLRSVTPDGASTPFYVLRDTIDVARDRSLIGDGWRTRIKVPADGGDFDGDIMFRLNTDAAGEWVAPFPGFPASSLESLHIQALDAAAAGHNIIVAQIGGSQSIEDFYVTGVDQLALQIDEYCDLVTIRRGFAWKKKDTANYLIDLGTGGDGVLIDQVGMSHEPTDTDRPKLVYLRFKNGATLSNLINGDIYVQDSHGVDISALHHETGHVTFDNASGQLRNAVLYMRGAASGDQAGTPLTVTVSEASATSFKAQQVTIADVAFAYTMQLIGDYPTDGTANFQITANGGATNRGRVSIRNAYRWIGSDTNQANNVTSGITCGHTDFDSYSHLASVHSDYDAGAWSISGDLPALASSSGLDSVSNTDSSRPWGAASGTYYYKVVNYHDTRRGLGRVGSSEQSVALTNGGNGAALVLNSASRCRSMIRVYRGTATGSYDEYVDVPFMSGGRLYDAGDEVNGFPWVARSAGAVDSVNANLDAGYSLRPGETGAASDAYGRVEVFARSLSTAPTVGSWRRGDVIYGPPTVTAAGVQVGWRRITDCTTASPTHVMGTDWTPLYVTTRGLTRGTSTPNGVVTGDPGDVYLRSDGTLGSNLIYVKTEGSGTNTGWNVTSPFAPATGTTSNFTSIASDLNTKGKVAGKMAFNTTTSKPVWATGSTAASVWVDATGATAHTPA